MYISQGETYDSRKCTREYMLNNKIQLGEKNKVYKGSIYLYYTYRDYIYLYIFLIYIYKECYFITYLFSIDLKQNNLDECQNKINSLIQVN